jgi:putative endonuclease
METFNYAWVYILTNAHHTVLYVGLTNNLARRLWEHRTKRNPKCFTAKYNIYKLVYYEGHQRIEKAIRKEKFIKVKTRAWKEELIIRMNPDWKDLTEIVESLYS